MSNFYTNPNTCEQHPVASCGGCGTPAPKPCKSCPRCPVLCPETCQQPTHGISQPRVGLQERYIVGLGNEDRINTNGLVSNTEFNSIPWYWLAESNLDPEAPFTPKRYDRCDGKYFEAPDRNTYHLRNANGTIIKTWKNPFSTLNALAGITINVTDANPVLNENVFVKAGDPIKLRAGLGIDLKPKLDGTIEIVNTSIIEPTFIQRVSTSGITLQGTGTSTNPYLIGIDCGTLSVNCGLVKSVNGATPDENGNVVTSGNSSGINSILPDVANIISFTPTSSGILQTNFNCSNLKLSCNLLDTSSFIPLSRIAQSNATIGQIPVWNGTSWVAQTPSGGSTTVQYQEEGTNTGSTNPTVVNFTGSGVTASQSGGVVTVNVPGGVGVLNQGFDGRYLASGITSIPAGTSNAPVGRTATVLQVFNNPTPSLFTVSGTAITFNQSGEYQLMFTPKIKVVTNSTTATLYPLEVFCTYAFPGVTSTFGTPINNTVAPLYAISGGLSTTSSYSHVQIVNVTAGQTINNITFNMQKTDSYSTNATIDMNLFEFSIGIYKLK